MAQLIGNEPVSAGNLAAALGIETGGGRSRVTSASGRSR